MSNSSNPNNSNLNQNNNNNNNNKFLDKDGVQQPISDWVMVRNSLSSTNANANTTNSNNSGLTQQQSSSNVGKNSNNTDQINSFKPNSSTPINIPGVLGRKNSFKSGIESFLIGSSSSQQQSAVTPTASPTPSPKDMNAYQQQQQQHYHSVPLHSHYSNSMGSNRYSNKDYHHHSHHDQPYYHNSTGSLGESSSIHTQYHQSQLLQQQQSISGSTSVLSTSPTTSSLNTSHDKKCYYCTKDLDRNQHQYEHEIVDIAQNIDRLQQYKIQQNIIPLSPPIHVDQDIIGFYNQSENFSSQYYNILTQLDLEHHNITMHLTEIVKFLDELEEFTYSLDIGIFNRLGDNIKIMYDHLSLIKNDLLDTQNKNISIQFKGYLAITNHTLNNLEKSTQQFTLKFLHSITPFLSPPTVLFTDTLKKYAKISITKQKNTPLGCEWRISLIFTKSLLEIIKYCDPIKAITLLVYHSSSQTPQYFHVKNKPIIINEEKQFIGSVNHFCSDLQSLLQKEEKFYLVYLVNNIKYLLSVIPKQTRELTKLEIEKLQILMKKNPNTYLKEVIPFLIKNLYIDPLFFHFWNQSCLHLINTKDPSNDLNQLMNTKNSFIISFDEKNFVVYFIKTNSRTMQSESFTNLMALIQYIQSNQSFTSIILSNKEVQPIQFFNSILPLTLPTTYQPISTPHHITLCGPCISTLKDYLERMNQELQRDYSTYTQFIIDHQIHTKQDDLQPTSPPPKPPPLPNFTPLIINNNNNKNNENNENNIKSFTSSVHRTKEWEDLSKLSDEELEIQLKLIEQEEMQLMNEYLSLERTKEDIVDIKSKLEDIRTEIKSEEKVHYNNVNHFYQEYFNLLGQKKLFESQISTMKEDLDNLNDINIVKEVFQITFEKIDEHTIVKINDLRLGTLPKNRVEWDEINGAMGQIVLLVHTIAKQLNYTFSKHKLIPMGNKPLIQSKVDKEAYPLYGGDDIYFRSFIWSREHKFDVGMEAFLGCVNEISSLFKTVVFPFKIEKDKIGGNNGFQSIRVTGNSEVNWTKALKYMVTNIKCILANLNLFVNPLTTTTTSTTTSSSFNK